MDFFGGIYVYNIATNFFFLTDTIQMKGKCAEIITTAKIFSSLLPNHVSQAPWTHWTLCSYLRQHTFPPRGDRRLRTVPFLSNLLPSKFAEEGAIPTPAAASNLGCLPACFPSAGMRWFDTN